jgi:hypothetical protein
MKKIKLTRGKFALVDDNDFDWLNQWKWHCTSYGYAVREVGGRKSRKVVWMHRLINETPDQEITDHINRDRLDNRRANLRTVTATESIINRGMNRNNTSGHKGVIFRRDTGKWQARIKVAYKDKYLGCFEKLEDAIKARQLAEGEF